MYLTKFLKVLSLLHGSFPLQISPSAHSPKSWNSFAKRLSGNTEFITSRFIKKAKECAENTHISPTNSPLDHSHSFNKGYSVQRSWSQTSETPSDTSSITGYHKTLERKDSAMHQHQIPSDSSTTTGYETPEGKYSDTQQYQTGDYKTSESKFSNTQLYYDAKTDSSPKSSKSNSAIHSRGSSYDYDNSYTYSGGTSSNVRINLLLFYLLIYVSIYFFMTLSEISLTLLW